MVSALGKTTRRETSLEPEPGSVTLRGFSQANTTVTASSAAETAATRSLSRATRVDSLNRKGIVLRSCHSDGQKKSRQRCWDFAGGPADVATNCRVSPVTLRHRLSAALLLAASSCAPRPSVAASEQVRAL